jgi:hypothetical protein
MLVAAACAAIFVGVLVGTTISVYVGAPLVLGGLAVLIVKRQFYGTGWGSSL